MPDPWERLPGESTKAFEAFKRYRDQPPSKRSIDKSAMAANERQTSGKRASGRIWAWASQHRWVQRVAEFDRHNDALDVEEAIADAKEWRRLKRKATAALAGAAVSSFRHLDFAKQSVTEAVRNYRIISDLRDAALGLNAVEQPGQSGSAPDTVSPVVDVDMERFAMDPDLLAATVEVLRVHEWRPDPADEPPVEPELSDEPPVAELDPANEINDQAGEPDPADESVSRDE